MSMYSRSIWCSRSSHAVYGHVTRDLSILDILLQLNTLGTKVGTAIAQSVSTFSESVLFRIQRLLDNVFKISIGNLFLVLGLLLLLLLLLLVVLLKLCQGLVNTFISTPHVTNQTTLGGLLTLQSAIVGTRKNSL
jgi:hypothetical protein